MFQGTKHLRSRHCVISSVGIVDSDKSAGSLQGVGGTVRSVLVAVRGRSVVLAAIVLVLAACSPSPHAKAADRAGAVYDAVVRWFAKSSSSDPDPLPVFIEPRGEGASIKLDVQAALVKSAKDVATVRFIDSRDEALVTNDDGTVVVADGGILLRLAPVVEEGDKIQLDVDVHDHDEQFRTLQFNVDLVNEQWTIEQPPTELPAG